MNSSEAAYTCTQPLDLYQQANLNKEKKNNKRNSITSLTYPLSPSRALLEVSEKAVLILPVYVQLPVQRCQRNVL